MELRSGKANYSCEDNEQYDTQAMNGDLRYAIAGRPRHGICRDWPPAHAIHQAEHTRMSMSRTALYNGPGTKKLCTHVSARLTLCSETWCWLLAAKFHSHVNIIEYRSVCLASWWIRTQCCTLRNTVPDHSSDEGVVLASRSRGKKHENL